MENMQRSSLIMSGIFHAFLLAFMIFGLPSLSKRDMKEYNAVPIEIVDVDQFTNIKQRSKMKKEVPQIAQAMPKPAKELPKPPAEKKAEEAPKPEPVKEDVVAEAKEEAPADPKVENIPDPFAEPIKKAEEEKPKPPAPDLTKVKKPKPIKRPVPPKKDPEPQKQVASADEDNQFDALLKNIQSKEIIEQVVKVDPEKKEAETEEVAEAVVNAPSISEKLSISEEDALRRQIEGCWSVPAGARDAENLVVDIRIEINPDRTVKKAEILNGLKMAVDPFYRAAAESARRAVLNPRCSPLQLPENKYEQWKVFVISFNPRDMLKPN